MSDRSGGFFSSVSRLFTGSKSKESDSPRLSAGRPPSSPREKQSPSPSKLVNGIRYLSPSALDSSLSRTLTKEPVSHANASRLELNIEPVSDIFSHPLSKNLRKRQLTETDPLLLPPGLRSDSVKRSRSLANRSYLEPSTRPSLAAESRFDTTWSGALSSTHSPASSITNYSLLSRRSGIPRNGSELSSSTQYLLRRLQNTNTPAKDVQRMPLMRPGMIRSEKWAANAKNKSTMLSLAPPLRKAAESVPSRIQLLSKAMAVKAQKKPYWRDLTRRRSDKESEDSNTTTLNESTTANGNGNTSILSSLFSESTKERETPSVPQGQAKKHQSTLKGSDGKAVGRNTYRFDENDVEIQSISDNWMSKTDKLLMPNAAPARGFLNGLSFSFNLPKEVTVEKSEVVEEEKADDDKDDEEDSDKNSDASSTSDETPDSNKEESSSESDGEYEAAKKKPSESRPMTSTDTVSAGATPQSSQNGSPNNGVTIASVSTKSVTAPAAANWSCDGCFTSWPASQDECGCCGGKKGGSVAAAGPPAQKQLISNLSTFASKPAGSFSFGFGAISSSTAATSATTTSTNPSFGFGLSKPIDASKTEEKKAESAAPQTSSIAPTPAPVAAPAAPIANGTRSAWDCPDCCIGNTANDDKCVCCGYVKYKSEGGSAASKNVFGDRAFKASASATGISFGLGSSTSSTTKPSFGFGTSTPTAPAAEKKETASATTTFGFEAKSTEESKSDEPSTVTPTPAASFFGSTNSIFGAKPVETALPATATAAKTSVILPFGSSTTSTPMFGSSIAKPVEPVAPAPVSSISADPVSSISAAPVASPAAAPSVFGAFGTTKSLFGTSITAPAPVETAPTATTAPAIGTLNGGLSFGAHKASIFASSTAAAKPFGSTSTTVSFGKTDSNAEKPSTGPSMFGSSTAPKPAFSLGGENTEGMFGSIGTTTTDGASAAKKGLFAADSTSTQPKPFTFGSTSGTAAPAPFAFGSTTPAASAAAAPSTGMFGVPSGSTGIFGSTTSAPAPVFGGFGSSSTVPSVQSNLSTSSSTNSLFGQQPTDSQSKPFQFDVSKTSFTFGSSSSTALAPGGSGVFVFGSAAPAPAPPAASGGAPFQFGAASSQPPAGVGAFAYQPPSGVSQGARKMAMARRRIIRKP